jgi:hemerythrin-like metal-binding protein
MNHESKPHESNFPHFDGASDPFLPNAAQHPGLPGPLVEWQNEYSVEVGALDEHHRHIFQLLNRLHEAMLLAQGRAVLASLLDELIVCLRQHFAGEELLMQSFGYPESLVHELEHERLVGVLLEFREQFADRREQLVEPLVEFLEGWVIRHILTVDRRYSDFFAERGAKS